MYSLLKKSLLISSVAALALVSFNGCKERELPTDQIITVYNSELEETTKMAALDTMYVKIGGMEAGERYQIIIQDSDRNEITSTDSIADDDGIINPVPVWYDVGLQIDENGSPSVKFEDGLQTKTFYINVQDLKTGGNYTNFYQPFTMVITKSAPEDTTYTFMPKSIVYACNSAGTIENAFEESGSTDHNGDTSDLTKVYVKADMLPSKTIDSSGNEVDVSSVDIYIIPASGVTLTDGEEIEGYITKKSSVAVTNSSQGDYKTLGATEVWDLNGNNRVINPTDKDNMYSVIIDVNKDGKYNKGVDIDNDNVIDQYIDGVDGNGIPGFIIQDTPANNIEANLYDSNTSENKKNAVLEQAAGLNESLYLKIDNIATDQNTTNIYIAEYFNNGDLNSSTNVISTTGVTIKKADEITDNSNPTANMMPYIENTLVFTTEDTNGTNEYNVDISADKSLSIIVDLDKDNIYTEGVDLLLENYIKVGKIDLSLATYSSESNSSNTITFNETGSTNGTAIYLGSNSSLTNKNVYLTKHDPLKSYGSLADNSLVSKTISITANGYSQFMSLDSDLTIKNPKVGENYYDIVLDDNGDGSYDSGEAVITIAIKDTEANNIPDVKYINIASTGFFTRNRYTYDQTTRRWVHNSDAFGYEDEFNADGSDTKYSYGSNSSYERYGRGIKAIWNPYTKSRWSSKRNYKDENGNLQASPFNYGQKVDLYVLNKSTNALKQGMTLSADIDARGFKQTLTVQYSCSNGCGQQLIWKASTNKQMPLGEYYVVIDLNRNGTLDDGIDLVDAVTQDGKNIKDDNSIVGFEVVN